MTTVMALQSDSAHSRSRRHTLKLLAQIGKKQVLILVDSGSIGTFVSDHLVQSLQLPTTTCDTFRIADRSLMTCNTMVPDLSWFIQGHTFNAQARVLSLRCYDVILGEDWLEQVSPVWVDYKTKLMRVTHKEKRIQLPGVVEDHKICPSVSSTKLQGLVKNGSVWCMAFSYGLQEYHLMSNYWPLIQNSRNLFLIQLKN